ncbi:hypothetical protein TNCT_449371 [Trichonephila clavata]|uniref:Sm domain-containing protein n=1 Tax=Trichonephila clavata TaxID=2740835 RepID=A0A8X6KQP9_TRICU|nr:hypothetical protein TNCT_449371 [Trichonephila clavata]
MSATVDNVPIVNPRPFLRSLVGKWVIMKLKWGLTLKGRLVISDQYVNIQLDLVEIYDGETLLSHTHTILIRCNSMVYIHELHDEECEKIVSNWQSRGEFHEIQQQG